MLGLDYTVTGDTFDPKKLKESWVWLNQRLIKNNKLLKARNLKSNSERLVDSTDYIQRHLLLIPQAFNIFQRFSPIYTCNVATKKKRRKKIKNKHGRQHLRPIKYLIVSIKPTA